ncbi:MAG: HAMP domain-containing sensor histidine kinase [Dehalococcoidia bacterium]
MATGSNDRTKPVVPGVLPQQPAEADMATDGPAVRLMTSERDISLHHERTEQLAHDLLNSLTALKGLSQSILRRIERGRAIEVEQLATDMRAADDAVKRAIGEIGHFLSAARTSARPVESALEPADIVSILDEALEGCRRVTTQHRFVVLKDADSLVGACERGPLLQTFDNVLRNAIKYSPNGGTITVSLCTESPGDAGWAVISVRDEGMGIPEAELPHIFERFYRADNVTGMPGTGLGLHGVQRIIETHGGAVQMESVEGQGCVLTIRLPLLPSEESHSRKTVDTTDPTDDLLISSISRGG